MKSITRMLFTGLIPGMILMLPGCLKIHPQVERQGYGRGYERASAPSPTYYITQRDGVFRYEELIRWKSSQYQIDYYLMLAIVQAESSGNPNAISSSNCRGLTQLKLTTAREYDRSLSYADLHDPKVNIEIASRHMVKLRRLVREYFPNSTLMERVALIAASWNAGWGRVRRNGGIPDIAETQRFVHRVEYYYKKYRWGN